MTLAGQWYGSATMWAAVTAVLAATAIGVGAWATLRASNPRRRLLYGTTSAARLINASDMVRNTLRVTRAGTVLADPHVLVVEVRNDGRRDVASGAYDAGQPIRLDLGAPVVDVLESESTPAGIQMPTIAVSGTELHLGPSLIAKGQRIRLTVLVDGPGPQLTFHAALVDVQVTSLADAATREARRKSHMSSAMSAMFFIFILWAIVSSLVTAWRS